MIWYSEAIKTKNQPPDIDILLVGSYNHPSTRLSIIMVELVIGHDRTLVFEKNPAILGAVEDPSPDDVWAKYSRNILRLRDKFSRTDFKDLQHVFK